MYNEQNQVCVPHEALNCWQCVRAFEGTEAAKKAGTLHLPAPLFKPDLDPVGKVRHARTRERFDPVGPRVRPAYMPPLALTPGVALEVPVILQSAAVPLIRRLCIQPVTPSPATARLPIPSFPPFMPVVAPQDPARQALPLPAQTPGAAVASAFGNLRLG